MTPDPRVLSFFPAFLASQLSWHCGHPLCVLSEEHCCCPIVVIGQLKSCDKLTAQNLLPARRLKLLMKKYCVRSFGLVWVSVRVWPWVWVGLILRLCSAGMRQHFAIAIDGVGGGLGTASIGAGPTTRT